MDVIAARVPHQGFADVLHHAGFHKPRVERVAQVVEAHSRNSRAMQRQLPRRLDEVNWPISKREDQARLLPPLRQDLEDSIRERYLSPFAFGSLGPGDIEKPAIEIDVLP